MIIVIDTNIWISELGLNSPLGAAIRFFINQNNAKVALPEVVRLETEIHLRSRLKEFIEAIIKNHRQLLIIFGKLKEVVLPNNDAIENKIASIFGDLGVEIIDIPFSLESAKNSFLKTVEGVPPSGNNNQQFKDGVLWADCIELLKTDNVLLVTEDKGFFKDREYSRGLAENLAVEASSAIHSIRLFSSLTELLMELKVEVRVDQQLLVHTFVGQNQASIDGILKRNGFAIDELEAVNYTLFATEQPNNLYLEFTIIFSVKQLDDEAKKEARLTLRGDGSYDADSKSFVNMRNFGEKLSYELDDGNIKEIQNYVIHMGGAVIGHREVINTSKYKLD